MAHGLHEHEHCVQHERSDAGEHHLRGGKGRAAGGGGVGGQHQGEDGERGQHRQRGVRPFGAKAQDVMAQAADEDAQADGAVAHDHDRGEHGFARQRGGLFAADQHQGYDQRHLDHGDGDREDQRAERLADPQRDHLCMVDRGDDCTEEGEYHARHRERAQVASGGHLQDPDGDRRQQQGPRGQRAGQPDHRLACSESSPRPNVPAADASAGAPRATAADRAWVAASSSGASRDSISSSAAASSAP